MEKYYLFKLTDLPDGCDVKNGVRLVEINYARKPPSFGLVYLATKGEGEQQIRLACLELFDNQSGKLSVIKSIDLSPEKLIGKNVVYFDVNDAINITETLNAGSEYNNLQAILLLDNGNLLGVNFNGGDVRCFTGNCEPSVDSQLLQCILEFADDNYHAHLLAERNYSFYKITKGTSLELINQHSLTSKSDDSSRKFSKLHLIDAKSRVVLIELNDSRIRLLRDFKCISELTLDDDHEFGMRSNDCLVLSNADLPNESFIFTINNLCINAYSLQLSSVQQDKILQRNNSDNLDPDQILIREPSFELELCWSIDLKDIDSLRALTEDDELEEDFSSCCPSFMHSSLRLNTDSKWPKFFIVTYKCHLLVYSFEQQPVLPFSVVYDKAFLKIVPTLEEGQSSKNSSSSKLNCQDFVDIRQKPKLIQNFKLIGSQPTDSLFNTLFLALKSIIISIKNFAQLGILVCLTNQADVLAFKITSSKIISQKDSLYQQTIVDSLKSSLILKEQIERLLKDNLQFGKGIESLEYKLTNEPHDGSSFEQMAIYADNSLQVQLKQDDSFGCLYGLEMNLPSFLKVGKLVVLITVNSYILKPSNSTLISSVEIDNDCLSRSKPIVLSNITMEELKSNEEFHGSAEQNDISSWAVLELNHRAQNSRNQITLPVYIIDGQSGYLKVFYNLDCDQAKVLDNSFKTRLLTLAQQITVSSIHDSQESPAKYYLREIPIKPLISYKSKCSSNDNKDDDKSFYSLKIGGKFSRQLMLEWIEENFTPMNSTADGACELYSSFTHCSIDYLVEDNQVSISSDDVIALEVIKKHIFKRATDGSMQLSLSQATLTIATLKHLIGAQYKNVVNLIKLLSKRPNDNIEINISETELLLENLFHQVDLDALALDDFEIQSCKDSLRLDIEALLSTRNQQSENKPNNSQPENDHLQVYKDLICGFILDTLVDYDKLINNTTRVTEEKAMLAMRSRLLRIFDEELHNPSSREKFVDKILNDWNENKKL